MKFELTYNFSSNHNVNQEGRLEINHPKGSLSTIDKMKSEDDIVYIYNKNTCEQLEVTLIEGKYLIRDFLKNGFYKKIVERSELESVLFYFDNDARDPQSIGMESFE